MAVFESLTARGMKAPLAQLIAAGSPTSIPVPIAEGGTGQVTAVAAFDALSPTTTRGDLIARGASSNGRLAVGADNSFLGSDGTDPLWRAAADARGDLGLGTIATQNANGVSISGGSITGITDLAVADGGTGASNAAGARTSFDVAQIPANGVLPVGSYAFLYLSDTTAVANGNTTSGGNLSLAVATAAGALTASGVGTVQAGTWLNISGVTQDADGTNAYGYWKRTA